MIKTDRWIGLTKLVLLVKGRRQNSVLDFLLISRCDYFMLKPGYSYCTLPLLQRYNTWWWAEEHSEFQIPAVQEKSVCFF